MSLTGTLAAFALRYTLNESADKLLGAVERHFTDHSRLVPNALIGANEKAWRVVGLALAGESVLDRVADLPHGRDVTALRDEIRAFLVNTPTGLDASPAEVRARACAELNRLRRSGRLAFRVDPAAIGNDIGRYGDPARLVAETEQAVAAVADALQADAPNLAAVLRLAPPGGPPLFASAFLFFFRRAVEGNEELSRGLTFDALRALTAAQDRGIALLKDGIEGILDQFDALFEALDRVNEGIAELKDAVAGATATLAAGIRDIQQRLAEPRKPGVSYDTEAEREFLRRALEQFRSNPGLANAESWGLLGDAMSAARLYTEAGEAHETAATRARATRDTETEAANHYKAYLDACDAGAWAPAFDALWKAVALEPARYRPFDNRRYRPERILGVGAFGTVFLCHDLYGPDEDGNPSLVAIKAFRTEALDQDLTKVFAEARVLKALKHPSIIGVLDQGFGDQDTQARRYLVLEYFPGQTLDQLGTLPLSDFLVIARIVAGAVHAAHSRPRPIYHRDLKPSNVMVLRHAARAWTVKVIDFGLAVRGAEARSGSSVPEARRSTRDRSVTGTLKYAPPEQLGELPGVSVGAYSDVYAFGKTFLDVLFRTTAPKSWDWKTVPDDLRGPLLELFERCTADAIEHRYRTFEPVLAVLADLDRAETARLERFEREEAERNRQSERAAVQEAERERIAAAEVARKRQADQAERVRVAAEAARLAVEKRAREEAERREAEVARTAAEQHQQDVDRQRKEADHDRRAEELRAAITLEPENAQLHFELGNALYASRDLDGAEAAYEEAIALDLSCAKAHAALGTVLRTKGDLDGAIVACKAAIALDPTDAAVHFNLGRALGDKGDLEGAIAAYKQAIELEPRHASAHSNLGAALNNLGVSLFAKGDLDGAEAAFKEAIRIDPTDAATHFNLGAALHGKGDLAEAIVAHKRAIKLAPAFVKAHFDLGLALYAEGDLDGAEAAYKETIRIDPTHATSHTCLGIVLGKKGDLDGAVAAFKEAIRIDPTHPRAHNELGCAHKRKGNLDGAIAAFKAAIQIDPSYAHAHNNLGLALYAKGDLEGAITAHKQATELEPTDAVVHNNLREVLQRQEVRKKAQEKASAAPAPQTAGDRAAGSKLKVTLPGGVVMRFAWCPPGSFQMGSEHPKAAGNVTYESERPVQKVSLTTGFFMGIYPVTQAQWKAVMGTDPSHFKGANRPVENVSWEDCRGFCERLTARLKRRVTVRLPTEAEWEYACRAGTTTEYHFGDVLDTDLANYDGKSSWNGSLKGKKRKETTDVGSFPPNPWGLFDMHGNVGEWCADWYGSYARTDQIDPQGRPDGKSRVLRGGSWTFPAGFCRSASRGSRPPAYGDLNCVGFRVCLQFDSPADSLMAVREDSAHHPDAGTATGSARSSLKEVVGYLANHASVPTRLRERLKSIEAGGGEEAVEDRLNTEAVVKQLTQLGPLETEALIQSVADSRGVRTIGSKFRAAVASSIHALLFREVLAVGENQVLMLNVTPSLMPADATPADIARAVLFLRAEGDHDAADALAAYLPPPDAAPATAEKHLSALRARGRHKEAEYLALHLPR